MIVIGASMGGLKVLQTVLRGLPHSFPLAVAVVLHRPKETENLLIPLLQDGSELRVSEAMDKEPIQRGRVYVAPSDYHLLVEGKHFSLSTDDPVQYARPSIDVLFESAADAFGSKVIGVILTGAGMDGAHGVAQIQHRGGRILIQDPVSAESAAMPLAALKAAPTAHVRSLNDLATELNQMARTIL
jgi:two-component system chemotaxis response regulator CheB